MAKIYNIAVIKGDGIGPEIVDEAIKALDAASAEFGFELGYNYYLMGGAAIDVFGEPLPSETLNGALNSDAVLFGAKIFARLIVNNDEKLSIDTVINEGEPLVEEVKHSEELDELLKEE